MNPGEKPVQRGIIGILLVAGFFCAMAVVLYIVRDINWKGLDGGTAGIIGTLIGSVVTATLNLAQSYVGWLFGSSAGSERKTELLAQAQPVPPHANP